MSKNSKTSTVSPIQNGIQILENAISNGLSAIKACEKAGFGKNYVSDLKRRLDQNEKAGIVNKTNASKFRSLVKRHEKEMARLRENA